MRRPPARFEPTTAGLRQDGGSRLEAPELRTREEGIRPDKPGGLGGDRKHGAKKLPLGSCPNGNLIHVLLTKIRLYKLLRAASRAST